MTRAPLLWLAALCLAACQSFSSSSSWDRRSAPDHVTNPSLRAFAADDPWRFLVIGDSLAQGYGLGLTRQVSRREIHATVINAGKVSTGLARGEFYDWPSELETWIDEARPDLIVAHFGANDDNSIASSTVNAKYGSPDWPAAYQQRLQAVVVTAHGAGVPVLLIAPTPIGADRLRDHMESLTPLVEGVARETGAAFLALAPTLTDPDGKTIRTVLRGTDRVRIRADDEVHFTMNGYAFVADLILDRLLDLYPQLVS